MERLDARETSKQDKKHQKTQPKSLSLTNLISALVILLFGTSLPPLAFICEKIISLFQRFYRHGKRITPIE